MVPPELLPFVGVPLSSDMSPDRLADDLPDVGWTLMIFTAIAECVGTGDVNQNDLRRDPLQFWEALRTLVEGDEPVGMQVPLMGWS